MRSAPSPLVSLSLTGRSVSYTSARGGCEQGEWRPRAADAGKPDRNRPGAGGGARAGGALGERRRCRCRRIQRDVLSPLPGPGVLSVALHRRFHDVLFDEVMSIIGAMAPGKDRLRRGRHHVSGRLPARPRGEGPAAGGTWPLPIAEEVTRRNRMNVDVVAPTSTRSVSRHPREAARLWIAATAECALMELECGRRDPAAGAALNALVR